MKSNTDPPHSGSVADEATRSCPTRSLAEFSGALLDHYDEHQRQLPWRGETDPYRVLVSEVMLQQTRVETVVGYYGRWIDRFPDLESLAGAREDEVLEAWEGLGYYRRARSLHRLAQMVMERPDRVLPGAYQELRELPGVGEYTAGAVASIAFGEPVPAPDGNVRRVVARLFDVAEPKPSWVRQTAATLVNRSRPGDWNEALMELGATICTPRAPACPRCPVTDWCAAYRAGTQAERPAPRSRPAPRRMQLAIAVLAHERRVLLERRPAQGLLAGMWAFPEAEVTDPGDSCAAAGRIAREAGFRDLEGPVELPPCDQRFTHVHATYLPWLVGVGAGSGSALEQLEERGGAELRWVDVDQPVDLALPVAQRRILGFARPHLTR